MTTRTIQMTLDSTLLDEVDVATRELDMTRSALIRSALAEYLLQVRLRRLERQDREAYDRCPATDADAEFWEALQDWAAPRGMGMSAGFSRRTVPAVGRR